MESLDKSFLIRIEELIAQVPIGSVTTYGDLAARAGNPAAARIVGGIAHYGDPTLPWHRLVNRSGKLASGYHGGREVQARHLEVEGVRCTSDAVIEFKEQRWRP